MPSHRRARLVVLAVAVALMASLTGGASGAGPGGWDHLGDGGTPGTRSLDGAVRALNAEEPGVLYVGGSFVNAGGIADADRIATWNGSAWGALGPSALNGDVMAIAYHAGKVYAGGTFTNAGGNVDADFLAVWDGVSWARFCGAAPGAPFTGNVHALQVIGSTLYIGGTFQNGAGIAAADYLVACDLTSGAASPLVANDGDSPGPVYALTSDSNGVLYAGGTFINMAGILAADHVAAWDGASWQAMGSGAGPADGAVTGIVRSVTANGTDVYVGSDASDIALIPQADNVAKWNGTAWSAMGSDASGANGWFPAPTSINGITTSGSRVFVIGAFQNANGDPLADVVASFDGSAWQPVGSNGAGDGPLNASGHVLAVFDERLYAGGSFTSTGGDPLAQFAASYPLATPPPSAPPPAPAPAPIAPRFLSFALSRTAFAAFPSGPSVRAARTRGTMVTYRLSEAAIVTLRVQRVLRGRRVGGRCVAPTRPNRTKPRCKRYRTLRGSFRHTGRAGLNRFRFSGRLARRTLKPGSYRLVASAKNPAANKSEPERRLFRIIRRDR